MFKPTTFARHAVVSSHTPIPKKGMIKMFYESICNFFSMTETVFALVCVTMLCQFVICSNSNPALRLFQSQNAVTGGLANTLFAIMPIEISYENASEVFRNDHTPICFRDGRSKSENYEYSTCVIFDIDNANSDDPSDWIHPDEIARRLKELGFNFWIVASRNHLLPKDGKAPRPKFHVYLMLSKPLHDGDKFVLYCKWCIYTFAADPKVKSKAQKLFGYGDNPNAFAVSWNEGRCIDEILTDDDLAVTVAPSTSGRTKKIPVDLSVSPPERRL